jgi:CMP-N-acetylneuraminic acid synthetase
MISGKKVLALIPARGGSKGIKGKNIIKINGMPLIQYTIRAAMNCKYIDDIIVSTDSEEIKKVALDCGAEVPFLRPKELAEDKSRTLDAVLYTIEELKKSGKYYDILVLLQPTSPLRDSDDVDKALELFINKSMCAVASVSEVKDNPILMRTIDDNGIMKKMMDISSTVRRQDMPVFYRVNGSIYINSIKYMNEETSFNDNPIPYIMKQSHSVDIDEYSDLALMKYYLGQDMDKNI